MVYVGIKVRIPLLIHSPLISPWYVTIVDEGNLKYFPQKDRKSETYDLAWSSFRGENQWWRQPRSQGSLLPALRNEVALASRNVGCFFRLVGGEGGGVGGAAQAAYHQTFLHFIDEGPKEKPPSFPRDIRRTS